MGFGSTHLVSNKHVSCGLPQMQHTLHAKLHARWIVLRGWLWRSSVVVPDFRTRADEGTECAICLVPFDAIVPTRTTACGHTFHVTCLTRWAVHGGQLSVTCPTCRGPLSFRRDSSPYTSRNTRLSPTGLISVRNDQMGCVCVYTDVSGVSELVRLVYDDGLIENFVISNGRERRTSVERPDGIVMCYNATDERLQSITYPRDGTAYFEGRAGYEKLITRKWANGQVTAYQGDAGRETPVCDICTFGHTLA